VENEGVHPDLVKSEVLHPDLAKFLLFNVDDTYKCQSVIQGNRSINRFIFAIINTQFSQTIFILELNLLTHLNVFFFDFHQFFDSFQKSQKLLPQHKTFFSV